MILEKEAKSGDTVTRVCDDCGKIDTLINFHKKNTNRSLCKGCNRKDTIEVVKLKLEQHGFEYISGKYKNNRSILILKCSCDELFESDIHSILRGKIGCRSCYLLSRSEKVSGDKNPMAGRFGVLNPAYRHGLSDEDRIRRRLDKRLQKWSYEIKKESEFKCDTCGKSSNGDLESHHLHNYADNLELALELSNGICLCHNCHASFHKKYGKKFNTEEQYAQFKEAYNGNKK